MTTTNKNMPDFIYVKDLPDNGGLRAARMKMLMGEVSRASSNGYERAIVFNNEDGSIRVKSYMCGDGEYRAISNDVSHPQRVDVREVYNLRINLAPQFASSRAFNW